MQIMPDWERLTKHIEFHAETKKTLGWVRGLCLIYSMMHQDALRQGKASLQHLTEPS